MSWNCFKIILTLFLSGCKNAMQFSFVNSIHIKVSQEFGLLVSVFPQLINKIGSILFT